MSVTATGAGISVATSPLILQVVEPPSFQINADESVTVARGSSVEASLGILARGGFSDNINMTLVGLPVGVTHNLPATVPSTGPGAFPRYTITASASTVPGTYPITLRGTSGSLTAEKMLTLTVQ
jgi:hypothetical protein